MSKCVGKCVFPESRDYCRTSSDVRVMRLKLPGSAGLMEADLLS